MKRDWRKERKEKGVGVEGRNTGKEIDRKRETEGKEGTMERKEDRSGGSGKYFLGTGGFGNISFLILLSS